MHLTSNDPDIATGILVDSVRIRNFRSLRNVEVALGQSCLLVGINNSGKTSFLRALHLALGADWRLIQPEDFFVSGGGQVAGEILIDLRIVPVAADGRRRKEFPKLWIESDFGGLSVISKDSEDNDFIAIRTHITQDSIKSDFTLKRLRLPDPSDFSI